MQIVPYLLRAPVRPRRAELSGKLSKDYLARAKDDQTTSPVRYILLFLIRLLLMLEGPLQNRKTRA
jgi:hypothetical protein